MYQSKSYIEVKDPVPARTPISINTSVPQELMGPKARLWVRSWTKASICSSEQDSLSCPNQRTALLQPAGGDTTQEDRKYDSEAELGEEAAPSLGYLNSPELHIVEICYLCGLSTTHNVAQGHQHAGVELTRGQLGGV